MKINKLRIGPIVKNNMEVVRAIFCVAPKYILTSLFTRIVSSIRSAILYVYLLGFVIHSVENNIPFEKTFWYLVGAILFLTAAFGLEAYYSNIYKPFHKEIIEKSIQEKFFEKQQTADMLNYDSNELYTIFTLANAEVPTRPMAVIDDIFNGLENLLTVVFIIIGSIISDWHVMGFCVFSFFAGILLTKYKTMRSVQYDEELKKEDKKVLMFQRLLYLPEYAKDSRLTRVHHNFLEKLQQVIAEKRRIVFQSGGKIAYLTFWENLFCSGICIDFLVPLYLCVMIMYFNEKSIAESVIAINACYQIQGKLEALLRFYYAFLKNGKLIERINCVDQISCNIENGKGTNNVSSMETLQLQDVSFYYPDGAKGLSKVSLSVDKGSKVAIVGRNGSGKTTLIKLILRLYEPSKGRILQNGQDIRDIDVSFYRGQFSTVFQDFNIYATTLRNNICMGEEANNKLLEEAMRKAHLENVDILDTPLTREFEEDGLLMSGGQMQRIALARAIYSDKDIVIMDEPTAAMDIMFERKFYDILFEHFKNKTVLFVSHRLSSVMACDKIVYMENGHILEEGTHEELMSKKGAYYHLFCAQFG